MKRRVCFLLGLGVFAASVGCVEPQIGTGTTTVRIGGRPGGHFTGSYVQDGYRLPVEGSLPFTFVREDISELEILKAIPDDPLVLAAQNNRLVWHYEVYSQAAPNVAGLRLRVGEGLEVEKLKAQPNP